MTHATDGCARQSMRACGSDVTASYPEPAPISVSAEPATESVPGGPTLAKRAEAVARRYISLRDRAEHPEGHFDGAGRFTLSHQHPCCLHIRAPSVRYPYSEMLHGRSLAHVLYELGMEDHEADVRAALRRLDPEVARRAARREEEVTSLHASILARARAWCAQEGMDDAVLDGLVPVLSSVRSLPVLRRLTQSLGPDALAAWWDERPRERGGSAALRVALRLWRAGANERAELARKEDARRMGRTTR